MTTPPQIALTVDLEDVHHGLNVGKRASGFEQDVDWIMALFEQLNVRATFFVLGDILHDHPDLVRRIAAQGHEIGFHGSDHQFLQYVRPEDFARSLKEDVSELERLTGSRIRGFRAPFFSITAQTQWCLDILADQGFEYDASIYPAYNDRYGWPGAPTQPARHEPSGLILFPVPLLSKRVPVAFSGGAYLRMLPYGLVKWALQEQARLQQPGMIYFHPWEISPALPWRSDASLRANITRHALRPRMRSRLPQLLADMKARLSTMADVISGLGELPVWQPMRAPRHAGVWEATAIVLSSFAGADFSNVCPTDLTRSEAAIQESWARS
jgi:polysaccharide deacetylase family protein (PEP-CTERM system associated)